MELIVFVVNMEWELRLGYGRYKIMDKGYDVEYKNSIEKNKFKTKMKSIKIN